MHSLYALTISARLTEKKIGNHLHPLINVLDVHFECKEKLILPHGGIIRCVESINATNPFTIMHFVTCSLDSNHK